MTDFTSNFSIKINGARAKNVGDLSNVIKQISWTMIGEKEGQSFELPQVTNLPDPDATNFIDIADLDEVTLTAWIESSAENLNAVKAHIEYVLNKELERISCEEVALPWMPIPEKITTPEDNLVV